MLTMLDPTARGARRGDRPTMDPYAKNGKGRCYRSMRKVAAALMAEASA